MLLNSDLIKTAEASPDTMITLINGEKLIVREELNMVVERVLAYRAKLLAAVARRHAVSDGLLSAASQSGFGGVIEQQPDSATDPRRSDEMQ